MLRRPRIVVTGGTGFLGRALVDLLLRSGDELLLVVRTSSDLRSVRTPSRIESIAIEASDLIDDWYIPELEEKLMEFQPDAVLHLANHLQRPYKPPGNEIAANVNVGRAVMSAFLAACNGQTFVNVTSPAQNVKYGLHNPPSSNADYKCYFEGILDLAQEERDLRVTSVEMTDTIGYWDPRDKLIPALAQAAFDRKEYFECGAGNQIYDVIDVYDAAGILVSLLHNALESERAKEPQTLARYFQVNGPEPNLQLRQVVNRFVSVNELEIEVVHDPAKVGTDFTRFGEPVNWHHIPLDVSLQRIWLAMTNPGLRESQIHDRIPTDRFGI